MSAARFDGWAWPHSWPHADGTPIEPPKVGPSLLDAPDLGDVCHRCGVQNIQARSVTANNGLRFCGIRHHDDWDRELKEHQQYERLRKHACTESGQAMQVQKDWEHQEYERLRKHAEDVTIRTAKEMVRALDKVAAEARPAQRREMRGLLVDRLGFERIVDGPLGVWHVVPYRSSSGLEEARFERWDETTRDGERLMKYCEVDVPHRLEDTSDHVHGMVHRVVLGERDAERQRANVLADECGRLKDENRELLVENATLRRQVEKLGRGKR